MTYKLSCNTIKIIAILTMTIDHIGFILLDNYTPFRAIGRVSFPLFAFLIANGFIYSKDIKNYLKRLLFIGGGLHLSSLAINYYSNKDIITSFNIFITLSLGLIILIFIAKRKYFFTLPFLLLPFFLDIDYSIYGMLLPSLFYLTRDRSSFRCFLFISFSILYSYTWWIQIFSILAIIPISLYRGDRGYSSKTLSIFFYSYYPIHLVVLYMIQGLFLENYF